MNEPKQRFDRLLNAMVTKPPKSVGKTAKEAPSSNEGDDAGCDDTQSPKDSSGDAS